MGETQQIHMHLEVNGNYDSIFEKSQFRISKEDKVEKINVELKKLDKKILLLQEEFNELLLSRAKLLVEIDEKKKNGR